MQLSGRQHNRGPHPADSQIFSIQLVPSLQQATGHLSWLLSRGYAAPSSLKLVGDRFDLVLRQRMAVMRSACSDAALQERRTRAVSPNEITGASLEIDALNLLITLEAALAAGVILSARDGTYRDMASIHGSYRKVAQTRQAIELVGKYLRQRGVANVLWRVDRPVSNSGRLRATLLDFAAEHQFPWRVCLDDDPDPVLGSEYELVVSADSIVLDRSRRWANLARWIIDSALTGVWIVPMTSDSRGEA